MNEMQLYVSPMGRDDWSGRLSEPDCDKSDGPFASIKRAQEEIRRLKSEKAMDGPVVVLLREGTYFLEETLAFDPRDSGNEQMPITYAAYPGEKPVISGGRSITGWERAEGELWKAEIPEAASGKWYFHQLFVDGKRSVRARTPNDGFLFTEGPLPGVVRSTGNPEAKIGFSFRKGDLPSDGDLDDANILLYHSYTVGRHWIDRLDLEKSTVRFVGPSIMDISNWEQKQRYYAENYFEALDSPGEWYLDRKSGTLYYWPLEGEDMRAVSVIAPVLRQLVRFQGSFSEPLRVEYIRFRGLSFQHADWLIPDRGKAKATDTQAAIGHRVPSIGSAIEAVFSRHLSFEGIEIAHVGEYALSLGLGCQDNEMNRSHIHDTGAGAIRIGDVVAKEEPVCEVLRNVVENNVIHDGGHVFPAGVGVWIGHASHNRVLHNEIYDFTYTGVSVGWTWQYRETTSSHNLIAFNHIYRIGKKALNDLGGIYTLGNSPGTIIRNNLIHDVYAYGTHIGVGVYLDQATTDVLVENNIVYAVFSAGFFQNWGKENRIQNNIFAFCEQAGLGINRKEEHLSFRFERNIVLVNNGEAMSSKYARGQWHMDYNLYWDISGKPPGFAGATFEEWQAKGHDGHSILADPMFIDANNYDFRLRCGSPATAIGFQPIDITMAGPRD